MRFGDTCYLSRLRVSCSSELLPVDCLSPASITIQVEIPRSEIRADVFGTRSTNQTKLSRGRELLVRGSIQEVRRGRDGVAAADAGGPAIRDCGGVVRLSGVS